VSKEARGHGGLIRKDKRVTTDEHGSTQVQHWDGRVDVAVKAKLVKGEGAVPLPGSKEQE
jgi:hypothetical protein